MQETGNLGSREQCRLGIGGELLMQWLLKFNFKMTKPTLVISHFQGQLDYQLQDHDEIVFISTLHGG